MDIYAEAAFTLYAQLTGEFGLPLTTALPQTLSGSPGCNAAHDTRVQLFWGVKAIGIELAARLNAACCLATKSWSWNEQKTYPLKTDIGVRYIHDAHPAPFV